MKSFSLNEIIETAVQIERSGFAFYDSALKRKDLTKKGKELIELLRDQELKHEKTFLNLRDQEDELEITDSQDWDLVGYYIRTIIESRLFNTPEAAIKHATEAKDEKNILENALSFEKDTILFFQSINDNIVDNKSKIILRAIINEEITHVVQLSKMLENYS